MRIVSELTKEKAEKLIQQGFESMDLDFKQTFDNSTGAWMELAKDVYGMANYGGGNIVFGVKDGSFEPVGMDINFHIDSQIWSDKLSKWVSEQIQISYLEYDKMINKTLRKFPILKIFGITSSFVIPKDNGIYTDSRGNTKTAFHKGVVYTRQNTSTVTATGEEFWKLFWSIFKRTASSSGSSGTVLEAISQLNKKAEPDAIEETLWFNLFPVIEMPDFIHVGFTKFRSARDIYNKIRQQGTIDQQEFEIPSFFLSSKKIYSFSPFVRNNPLSVCVTSRMSPVNCGDWLHDKSKHTDLVKLLNYNLKVLCRKRGIQYDSRKDRYLVRYVGGPVPEVTWKPYKSTSTRQLVNIRLKESGELSYMEHFGARMRFIILGEGIYLIIEPIRVLSYDGIEPLDQRMNTRISTRKNALYHNNNYLYDTKLWCHLLAENKEEIHIGVNQEIIKVSILAINSKVNFGILDDQHTGGNFLDSLHSEPIEYFITNEEGQDDNPLTETSMEE